MLFCWVAVSASSASLSTRSRLSVPGTLLNFSGDILFVSAFVFLHGRVLIDCFSSIFLIVLSDSHLLNSLFSNPNSSSAFVLNMLLTSSYLFSKELSSKSAKTWNLLLNKRENSFCCAGVFSLEILNLVFFCSPDFGFGS